MNITTPMLFVTLIFFKISNLKAVMKKKSMLQDFMNSWEGFSASCWLWNFPPRKTIGEMLEDVVFSWREVR